MASNQDFPIIATDKVLALNHVLDNVLSIPSDSAVASAFPALWIFNINDLMNLQPRLDLQESYTHYTTNEEGETVQGIYKLPPMIIRNIELLQQWYYEHTSPTVSIWFTLNETKFEQWKIIRFHLTGNNVPTKESLKLQLQHHPRFLL